MPQITPTPEFMEAFALSLESKRDVREEMQWLRNHPELSIRRGLADEQEQHCAVAAKWPHLYKRA